MTAFLDKEVKYDLDKVEIKAPEKEQNPEKERSMDDLFKQGTQVPGSDKVISAPPGAPASDAKVVDDAMKAVLDAAKRDAAKK